MINGRERSNRRFVSGLAANLCPRARCFSDADFDLPGLSVYPVGFKHSNGEIKNIMFSLAVDSCIFTGLCLPISPIITKVTTYSRNNGLILIAINYLYKVLPKEFTHPLNLRSRQVNSLILPDIQKSCGRFQLSS